MILSTIISATAINPNSNITGLWAVHEGELIDVQGRNQLHPYGTIAYTTATWGGATVDVFELDGSADWLYNTSGAGGTEDLDIHDTGGTYQVWIYPHDNTQRAIMTSGNEAGGNGESTAIRLGASGELIYASHIGGDYAKYMTGVDTVPANQWTLITLVINKTTWGAEIWINTTLDKSDSGFAKNPPDSNRFNIGGYIPSGVHEVIDTFDGLMYCPKVYNTSRSPADIAADFNGGVPQCDVITDPELELKLTVSDYHDNSLITNFTANISNGTHSYVNTTINEEVRFNQDQIVLNNTNWTITLSSNVSGGYLNATHTVNISGYTIQQLSMWQTEIRVNATNMWGGGVITDFNVSADGQLAQSNASGWAVLKLPSGNYSLLGASAGKLNSSEVVEVLPKEINFTTLGFFAGFLNVTAERVTTNTPITTFTINITQDSTGTSSLHTTTTGSVGIGVSNETYTLRFSSENYTDANVTLLMNVTPYNYTFQIHQRNSVYFNFFDQLTLETVNNVQLDLISTLYSNNYSTITGNISVELLTPETYVARFSSLPNYKEHLYTFTLVNGSAQNISLYMLNDSDATEVTVTIIDESADAVVGANVYIQRYNIVSNSYLTTEIVTTNLAGQAIFLATQNTEYYKFMVYYDGEFKPIFPTFSLITAPSYLISDTINIQVLLGSTPLQTFYSVDDITYNLIYNEGTNNFRLTYADPNGLVSQSCLKLYRMGISGQELINTTCLSSASGTLLIPVAVVNGTTYRVDAFVTVSDDERFLTSMIKRFFGNNTLGIAGVFLVLIISGVFAYAGRWDITIPMITIPIWLFIAAGAGLINLPTEAAIGLIVAGFLLAFIIAKRRGV